MRNLVHARFAVVTVCLLTLSELACSRPTQAERDLKWEKLVGDPAELLERLSEELRSNRTKSCARPVLRGPTLTGRGDSEARVVLDGPAAQMCALADPHPRYSPEQAEAIAPGLARCESYLSAVRGSESSEEMLALSVCDFLKSQTPQATETRLSPVALAAQQCERFVSAVEGATSAKAIEALLSTRDWRLCGGFELAREEDGEILISKLTEARCSPLLAALDRSVAHEDACSPLMAGRSDPPLEEGEEYVSNITQASAARAANLIREGKPREALSSLTSCMRFGHDLLRGGSAPPLALLVTERCLSSASALMASEESLAFGWEDAIAKELEILADTAPHPSATFSHFLLTQVEERTSREDGALNAGDALLLQVLDEVRSEAEKACPPESSMSSCAESIRELKSANQPPSTKSAYALLAEGTLKGEPTQAVLSQLKKQIRALALRMIDVTEVFSGQRRLIQLLQAHIAYRRIAQENAECPSLELVRQSRLGTFFPESLNISIEVVRRGEGQDIVGAYDEDTQSWTIRCAKRTLRETLASEPALAPVIVSEVRPVNDFDILIVKAQHIVLVKEGPHSVTLVGTRAAIDKVGTTTFAGGILRIEHKEAGDPVLLLITTPKLIEIDGTGCRALVAEVGQVDTFTARGECAYTSVRGKANKLVVKDWYVLDLRSLVASTGVIEGAVRDDDHRELIVNVTGTLSGPPGVVNVASK